MISVSAIVPTYNRAYVVCDAIKSILNQTYPSIEIIIVDDGSTDDTIMTLGMFGDKVHVISQPNAGPAAARNRGVQASNGEILTFLDSDDIWLPTYIERQVSLLERAGRTIPCSLSNGWLEFPDGKKRTTFHSAELDPPQEEGLWLNPDEVLATRFVHFNQMVAIRRDAFERVGLFDSKLKYLEDWDLALRLSLQRPWCFIREPLVVWKQQEKDSLSRLTTNERVLVRRTAAAVLTRAMERFNASQCSPALSRYVARELVRNNRKLFEARLSELGTMGRLFGAAMRSAEQIRELIWSYPNMSVESIA